MAERSEAVEEHAVRDGSAAYSVEPEIATAEDVPPGYKRTEVGVIPEDWQLVQLSQAASITTGKRDLNEGDPAGDFPFFTCARRHSYSGTYSFDCEAILIAGNGDVGNLNYYKGKFEAYQRTYIVYHFHLDVSYIWNQLAHRLVEALELDKIGSSIPYIKKANLAGFMFGCPQDSAEQRAIATALSDADALIESLDRLIAKKRAIKQAAMQQLLTGQTRLPGFTGEWETKPLGEIADIRSGGTPSTAMAAFWNGGVPWCTPTDITALRGRKYLSETERTISHAGLHASSAESIPPQSIIMTTRATIGECAINTVPMTTNQGFKNLVPFNADTEFLYYLMTTKKSQLFQLCGGSTFLEIGKKQLHGFELMLPPSHEEQGAIATVLSDMDAEIEALEHRRDKARQIKQGMMQQLLTGRVRLVTPEVAA